MRPCLYRLSFICATLLLSLTSPVRLTGTTLELKAASAQAQTTQNSKADAREWQQFTSTEGGFSVLMPGTPTERTEPVTPDSGSPNSHQLWLELEKTVYAIMYIEFPNIPSQLSSSQIDLLFNSARDGGVANMGNATVLRERNITLDSHPGREIEMGSPDGFVAKARMYWANSRLYLVMVGANTEAEFTQGADKFLDSFKLVLGNSQINGTSPQTQTNQDRKAEALRLSETAVEQLNRGQFREALQAFEQALDIFRSIGDRQSEGIILNNIGDAYRYQEQYPQALDYFQRALAIFKEFGNKAGEGTTLNNMGMVYTSLGQYADALKQYEQALPIPQQLGDKATEGKILNNIGVVYRDLGQYAQALKFNEQALVIFKEIGDKATEGTTLNNIGNVYTSLERYTDALNYYEQALVIIKEISDKATEGTILANMGEVYRVLGQYGQALKLDEQALVIFKQIGSKQKEGRVLSNTGQLYRLQGQYTYALKHYKQALAILQEISDKEGEWIILNNIGEAYNTLGQYAEAEKNLFAAIEVVESLRPGLTDANKVSIFETQASTYRFLQQALVAQNKINTALEIAERGRARAFVELLASRQFSNSNAQQKVKPPNIQQLQLIAKEQNATLVEYSIVYGASQIQEEQKWNELLYIWVVKPTGEVAFKQIDLKSLKTPLEDLITNSREAIGIRGRGLIVVERRDKETSTERLQQLHQVLIEPIAQFLPSDPNERIIFIPQNELFLVPFPALIDTSGKYLIEKYTILTAPSIQLLQLTREQRKQVQENHQLSLQSNGVLVVGNPTMPSNITTPVGEPIQLSPLPGAEKEASAIAQLFNTKALTGNQATKTTVTQQMEQARIIHLATHGLLDDFKGLGVPGAIALAPPEGRFALAPSANDNGLLTSSEILDMKLNAELVVLSACDTGRGTITGDGVIGLSRSLISAGVPSVIVSLWAVPDSPTASLMTQFYQNLSANPDKAQALRQAMLTTMKQHPNPRDWAAFTLIGEAE